jgi:hypothetical protein
MNRLSLLTMFLLYPLAPMVRADEGTDFFERKIRPVLAQHCYECHSVDADSLKANLFLDSREGMRRGGDSGPAVVPNDLEKSLILAAIRYETVEMPPDGRLPDDVITDFVKWVEMGAPDPREAPVKGIATTQAAEIDWEAARQFWSFLPPERHASPTVSDVNWVRTPIDGFILAQLDAAALSPSEPADRRTLIRRVTLDLIGLPPTPDEVQAFIDDASPRAYEELVERLLASPHYGERWARLWLDVARYAEDQAHIVGNDRELCYPNAYLYRDWVIAALNADMPYDEFLRRQLAADVVDPDDTAGHVALGFIGLGPKYYRRNAPEVMAEEWEDRVDTVARGLLGLTVACARCHHHKFDPIATEDYYALAGVFAGTEMFNRPMTEGAETNKDGQAKKPDEALHIVRDKEPRDLNVMIRGDVNNTGPVVPRRFLTVLCSAEPAKFEHGSGRLDLAKAIASRDNPLTARVIVNRIWGQHFGRPLVATTSNFGALGETPTHPELLDDLAVRFMDKGWSLKWLHREIVLSSAYQQSSHIESAKTAIDPANKLLWRMNRKRLDVETWRDSILFVAGRLDATVGGTSINPASPDESRRTIYSEISRLELNKLLALFDFPDPNTHNPGRVQTTTPLQKLFVLNSPFMVRQAEALRERLERDAGDDARARIARAYELLYGRLPDEEELELGLAFVGASAGEEQWTGYAHVLLGGNEMLVVD